jgi:hypothetical protein
MRFASQITLPRTAAVSMLTKKVFQQPAKAAGGDGIAGFGDCVFIDKAVLP